MFVLLSRLFLDNFLENLINDDSTHFKMIHDHFKFDVDWLFVKPFDVFSLNFCSFAQGSLI